MNYRAKVITANTENLETKLQAFYTQAGPCLRVIAVTVNLQGSRLIAVVTYVIAESEKKENNDNNQVRNR